MTGLSTYEFDYDTGFSETSYNDLIDVDTSGQQDWGIELGAALVSGQDATFWANAYRVPFTYYKKNLAHHTKNVKPLADNPQKWNGAQAMYAAIWLKNDRAKKLAEIGRLLRLEAALRKIITQEKDPKIRSLTKKLEVAGGSSSEKIKSLTKAISNRDAAIKSLTKKLEVAGGSSSKKIKSLTKKLEVASKTSQAGGHDAAFWMSAYKNPYPWYKKIKPGKSGIHAVKDGDEKKWNGAQAMFAAMWLRNDRAKWIKKYKDLEKKNQAGGHDAAFWMSAYKNPYPWYKKIKPGKSGTHATKDGDEKKWNGAQAMYAAMWLRKNRADWVKKYQDLEKKYKALQKSKSSSKSSSSSSTTTKYEDVDISKEFKMDDMDFNLDVDFDMSQFDF